jgi:hypothetical protein
MFRIMPSSHLSKFDQPAAGFLAILWLSNERSSNVHPGGNMPTHSRQHSDVTQIAKEILKEAARLHQATSVKEAFEKKNPASIAPKMLGRHKGGKTKTFNDLPIS